MQERDPSSNPNILNTAGVIGAATAIGATVGAYAANTLFSPKVQFIPGSVEGKAQIVSEEGLSITYGPTVNFPNVPTNIPGLEHAGIHLDMTNVAGSVSDPTSLEQIASLVTQYQTGIAEPIKDALIERLAAGAGVGSVIGGAVGYTLLNKYRTSKDKGTLPKLFNIFENLSSNKRKIVASFTAALAIAVTAGGASAASEVINEQPNNGSKPTPLPKSITNESRLLEGSTVQGLGSDLPGRVAKLIKEYKNSVEGALGESEKNFEKTFVKYSKNQDSNLNQFTAAGYTVGMHMSDTHCNYAMLKAALGPVSKAFKPSVILNTGDTFTNGGTMPYEKKCVDDLIKAVKSPDFKSVIINTIGNHDGKNPINKKGNPSFVTPESDINYSVNTPIGTVISVPDESVTTWETNPPEKSEEMRELIKKQGQTAANAACEKEKESGQKPIVMTHRPPAGYETSLRGCASLILNGHTHNNENIKLLPAENGVSTYQHTAGSASGAHNTLSIFETPKKPATYTILYFDSYNNLAGATTVTFDTNNKVKIVDEKLPNTQENQDVIDKQKEFLDK